MAAIVFFLTDGANWWRQNCQWPAQSLHALDRTWEIETKKTLQRVLVWYRPNTKSPGVVPAKYPLKVKLERISTTLEYQSWENCAYLDLWGLWDFYSSVELIFVSWRRRYFLIKKILINARILRDSFLVEIPLFKAQDISMYRHSWRSS